MDPTADGPGTDDPDASLLDALVQTSFGVIGVVSGVAAHHDLSLTQLRVLAILRDHTPTMSELARHLGLDRSTVTGLVDRAAERDLVQRLENEQDRRSYRVSLTEAGRALAATGAAEISAGIAPRVRRLSPTQRDRLTALLEALVADQAAPEP